VSPQSATESVVCKPDRLALFGLRFLAFVVDFFVFGLPFMYSHKKFGLPSYDMHALGLIALSFFVALGVLESKFGATPGKLMFRLRVVGANGAYPNALVAIIRRCLLVVDLLFGGLVGALSIFLTRAARRVGDTMTDTYVIELKQLASIHKLTEPDVRAP
jgi:uncharacterized RDD family membrane protein YckC